MIFKRYFLIIFFFSFQQVLSAQDIKVIQDFGFWLGVDVKKDLSNGFDLSLMQQVRTFKNTSEMDDYLLDLGLRYSINKKFDLGGNLRYTYDKKRFSYRQNNLRYSLDILFRKSLAPRLDLQYRLRYQKEHIDFFSRISSPAPQNIYVEHVRNRAKISFRLDPRNRLFLSSEVFKLSEIYRRPYFNKVRFYIGDQIKTRIGIFVCSFGFEKELGIDYPYSFFLFKTVYVINR